MENQSKDKREFFRVKHSVPLCASMSLKLVNDKQIETGSTNVCVRDIGPGGLCFWSNLNLPIGFAAIFEFKMKILEQSHSFYGSVIRRRAIYGDITEYGVKFSERFNDMRLIIQVMNNWSIALKKKTPSVLKHTCSFCTKKTQNCFNFNDDTSKY